MAPKVPATSGTQGKFPHLRSFELTLRQQRRQIATWPAACRERVVGLLLAGLPREGRRHDQELVGARRSATAPGVRLSSIDVARCAARSARAARPARRRARARRSACRAGAARRRRRGSSCSRSTRPVPGLGADVDRAHDPIAALRQHRAPAPRWPGCRWRPRRRPRDSRAARRRPPRRRRRSRRTPSRRRPPAR